MSDAQWARLEPLLPPEKPGRPTDDHRRILNGILWILNSVARPAAARVGTVSSRFYRWRMAARAGGVAGPGAGRLGVAFPGQHGRTSMPPGTGREPGAEALGRPRGGFTIHLRCEGYGKPVIVTVTEVHDTRQGSALISRGAIRRIGRATYQAGR
jgi:Putative transposase of IS4/5 family (DUF4096)